MARVLLADEDSSARVHIRTCLQDSGHTVIETRNGSETLQQLLLPQKPDVILLHLNHSGRDALSMLESISSSDGEAPVIVLSDADETADAREALRAGAYDWLVWPPPSVSLLNQAILRAVERRGLLRQLKQYQEKLREQADEQAAVLADARQSLEHKSIALREVLNSIQEQMQEAAQRVASQLEQDVLPLLRRLEEPAPSPRAIVEHIRKNLLQIISAQADPFARFSGSLTPSELRLCRLIRRGLSSKEIAQAEGISLETVQTHRRNIRRKLKIANSKANLTTYLQSLESAEDA